MDKVLEQTNRPDSLYKRMMEMVENGVNERVGEGKREGKREDKEARKHASKIMKPKVLDKMMLLLSQHVSSSFSIKAKKKIVMNVNIFRQANLIKKKSSPKS